MCGIMGYAGGRQAAKVLLDGLRTLEYRGYDSAGIAVIGPNGSPQLFKKTGKLDNLSTALSGIEPVGQSGIGHTRWATHGSPTDDNAHPHTDCDGRVVVAHNGIVENYRELKRELEARGHLFESETDSECIPHMIEEHIQAGAALVEAVRLSARKLKGANAVVAMSNREPGRIVGVRLGNAGGIVAGVGDDGSILSSDLPAILPFTRDVYYVSGGEMVIVNEGGVTFETVDGETVEKSPTRVGYDERAAQKGGHRHYMHKEIHEQPAALVNSLAGRLDMEEMSVDLSELGLPDDLVSSVDRVVFIGMGTSMHAAMIGRHWMESLARIPAEYDNSSEYRYREPVLDSRTLVVSISQSGETADTLAAMELAASRGARQITLCNFLGPQSTQVADHTLLIRAGQEIAVAGSKTFTCSLAALLLLAIEIGVRRGAIGDDRRSRIVAELARIPDLVGGMLKNEQQYVDLARKYARRPDFLFLGRGYGFPLAMEGALKLKEVSYIHAEGYPAGEMKHGPISLIEEDLPVVAIAPSDSLLDKMESNIREVSAREGDVIAIVTEGDADTAAIADEVITVPAVSEILNPFLVAIPMQMIAYHVGVRLGCDVDQPRNLAKTVTVE